MCFATIEHGLRKMVYSSGVYWVGPRREAKCLRFSFTVGTLICSNQLLSTETEPTNGRLPIPYIKHTLRENLTGGGIDNNLQGMFAIKQGAM